MNREEMENIINTRLNKYTLELSEHLAQTVQGSVQTNIKIVVNGKIDAMTKKLEEHTVNMKPLLDWFNSKMIEKKFTERKLKRALFWFGFIAALGAALGTVVVGFRYFFVLLTIKL